MSVKLYMDVHIPAAISNGLRGRGIDVLTTQQDGTTRLPDDELLDRGIELDRVIFSFDPDFLREAANRQRNGIYFSGVISAQRRKMTMAECLEQLELLCHVYEMEDMINRVEYLPF